MNVEESRREEVFEEEEDFGFELGDVEPVTTAPKGEPVYAAYVAPRSFTSCDDVLCETFDGEADAWLRVADWHKYAGSVTVGEKAGDFLQNDRRLIMEDEMKHHGRARMLDSEWTGGPLAVSLDVQFAENHNCGGGYIKLFKANRSAAELSGDAHYSFMFGPDKCGTETRKVHFIIQYTNEHGERIEEHLESPIDLHFDMRLTHQYGFVLDGAHLKVYVDNKVVREGDLKELMKPGFKNVAMIDDPEDREPEGWTPPPRMIPDPDAKKPEDWNDDEPELIPDPTQLEKPDTWFEDEPLLIPNMEATKPEDWNDEEDGEWIRPTKKNPKCYENGCGPYEPPMIPNPAYQGEWTAPLIPNPLYDGETYKRRQIENPNKFEIADPSTVLEPFNSVGFEIWTVQSGTVMDNMFVSYKPDGEARLQKWVTETYVPRHEIEYENIVKGGKLLSGTGASSKGGFFTGLNPLTLACGMIMALLVAGLVARRLVSLMSAARSVTKKDEDSKEGVAKDAAPKESVAKEADTKDGEEAAAAKASDESVTADNTENVAAGETQPVERKAAQS